ncbi:uncharacterized protein LOC143178525 [Calliopsis andreniformis]|uniref:uncharacterized protein LOC143178525 n=1 Tax=Calliopsis andreniformis TaxID=337506 RepID=UPI003FCE791C
MWHHLYYFQIGCPLKNTVESLESQYKEKPFGFGDVKEGRNARGEMCRRERKIQRAIGFNENRNILNSLDTENEALDVLISEKEPATIVKTDRMTRLLKWKAERNKHKELERRKKKPAFVVGAVHHRIYSPLNKDEFVHKHTKGSSKVDVSKVFPKGITKATEKRLISKAVAKVTTQNLPKTPDIVAKKELKEQKIKEQSIIPNDYKFKAPTGLPQMLFGRVPAYSMSPSRMSNFMSFSPMVRRSIRKSSIVQNTNNEKSNASIKYEKKDSDSKESSIEDISLKLSCDEDEKLHLSNSDSNDESSNNNKSKVEELNSKTLNDTITIISSSPKDKRDSVEHSDSSSSEPAFFSPYIVSSRGKSNARKEQQLRHGFSLGHSPANDIPTKDTVMKNLNISVEEEVRTAQYFQFLLNKETDKLNELCKKWEKVKDEAEMTEDAQYQINQAIGQTNLLIRKKFERFRSLVSDCETGKGEMLVTCKDLQGFWDMMYMEIQNCNSRFEKLEKLYAQGWEEEEEKLPSKPVNKKKTTVKNKIIPKRSSSLRTFLMEKKKKMAEKLKNGNDTEEIQMIGNITQDNKFEISKNNSISLSDRKSIPLKHEKTRSSLLCKVQLSETRIKSPLTIIKISQMCKTPDIQLDSSISYANSDQRPGKSILKQSKIPSVIDSQTKSSYKVNFDDNVSLNDIPVDEETQLKRDLAAALEKIDNLDFDQPSEDVSFNVQKKLNFEDTSFVESEDVHDTDQDSELKHSKSKGILKVPRINVQSATPRPALRRQNATEKDDEEPNENSSEDTSQNTENIRVLRNRSIGNTSFVESEDVHDTHQDSELKHSKSKGILKVSCINIQSATPRPALRRQNTTEKDNEEPNESSSEDTSKNIENIKVLRNRSIATVTTPTPKRKSLRKVSISVQESESEQNKTPLRVSSLKTDKKISSNINVENATNSSLNESNIKRRQSSRTVKFSEKECNICSENKPVLPVTPHVRRSTKRLSTKGRKSESKEEQASLKNREKHMII